MNQMIISYYPPTPENLKGGGESLLRDAMSREAIVFPETSPETIKTLTSPYFCCLVYHIFAGNR